MAYTPTIGLEVHVELNTRTKMFCRCANDPDEVRPNVNVCPVCLAHPGTLPVANYEAIHKVLRVGAALGSRLADYTEFDRKSYFYPDIPKGYQISQYEYPLVAGGTLAGIPITRVHLEEDTARSSHEGALSTSEVDFNRAGVPLMELVTEPAIPDSKAAGNFARELQLLLRTLGVSHANLEKGEMRIEANISVSNTDTPATAYVEVKNINSFRAVERAVDFEIARQTKLLEEGGVVVKETRGWDENTQTTFSQRLKEGSADYRYFPEPDLPKIVRSEVPEWSDASLAASLPELPNARAARYVALGLKESDAELIRIDARDAAFFDAVLEYVADEKELISLASNYFISDLKGHATKSADDEQMFGNVSPEAFAGLVRMAHTGDLSSRGAKDVLALLYEHGGDARSVAETHGLLQVSDTEALKQAAVAVIEANPEAAAQFRAGKEASLQFLLGQAMKATRGAGNPAILKSLLLEALGS